MKNKMTVYRKKELLNAVTYGFYGLIIIFISGFMDSESRSSVFLFIKMILGVLGVVLVLLGTDKISDNYEQKWIGKLALATCVVFVGINLFFNGLIIALIINLCIAAGKYYYLKGLAVESRMIKSKNYEENLNLAANLVVILPVILIIASFVPDLAEGISFLLLLVFVISGIVNISILFILYDLRNRVKFFSITEDENIIRTMKKY